MLKLVILRFLREIRLMGVLLLSMCLVTGFLSLGPLYVQALSASDFEQRVTNAADSELSVVVRDEDPFSPELPSIIDDNLGDYIGEQRFYAAAGGFTCGFIYDETAPENLGSSSFTLECYRPYMYDDFDKYFTILEGRYPQPGNPDVIEAIITDVSAEEAEYTVGDRIIMGNSEQNTVIVEFVGIVQIIGSTRIPFWQLQTMPDMTTTYFSPTDSRLDLSFAVDPDDFENRIVPVVGDPFYTQQFQLQREALTAPRVDDLEQSFQSNIDALRFLHPEIRVATLFTNTINEYRAGIENAQGPVVLLSFLVCVLMLYNIMATASLIHEQQSAEWSMMASRGGSITQLTFIQFETNFLLGVLAAIAGPLFGYLIMILLASVGPYAAVINISHIGVIPRLSVVLSLIASVVMIIFLTMPAWTAASKSLTELKSTMARAPKSPAWARYFVDIIVLLAGLIFMIRLILLSTDQPLTTVLTDSSVLFEVFAQDSSSALFTDPFNLAGPVLLLLGVSLLWLRVFPLIVRLGGSFFARGDGLTARLAFWNVERDPAHYAQLVLMLIGTLALGTASLSLSETRSVGGWEAARNQVGAEIALNLNPVEQDPSIDWDAFPTVIDAVPVMSVETQNGALIGLNPSDISSEELQPLTVPFDPLQNAQLSLSGLPVPDDATQLRLDVYAAEPEEEGVIDSRIIVVFEDATGVRFTVPFESDQSTSSGEFHTQQLDMPSGGVKPYRLLRLELQSEHDQVEELDHVIYMDNLVAVAAGGEQIVINSFEPDTYDEWLWATASRGRQVLESTAFSNDTEIVSEGTHSLRVLHFTTYNRQTQRFAPAILLYNDAPSQRLPIVVTQNVASVEGQASRFRRPLQVGDSLTLAVNLPTNLTNVVRAEIAYEIVGIVPNGYPSFESNDRLIFANFGALRYYLNSLSVTAQFPGTVYDINTVWLDIEDREPTADLITQLEAIPAVESVDTAWVRFTEIQRDPLTNAVTGMLFAGFWVSLFLGLMDFAFYVAITIRRRAMAFATLQAIGWDERNLLNLLLVEQVIFITPAVLIGILFGVLLANIILPFLSLIGSLQLQFPLLSVILLIGVLIVGFATILRVAAVVLRRLSLNQVMRFGE